MSKSKTVLEMTAAGLDWSTAAV